ncbi:FecCD family ABC transporter permease [Saccharospirillum salsuginis]|uniref:Hemin ABC transporter permease n=1 Tax=Saccharospirillum salsuginis TaxID=418750 RepID=A0A918K3C7_9GAMM|nr:iron ABC transporter permease [Saccharospirillum salsuginis]GGX45896.1 hemin ABC transporter permease [Saccharospirillum salsuginis]
MLRRGQQLGWLLLPLFAVSLLAGLASGPVQLAWSTLFDQLFFPDLSRTDGVILWQIRMPRILLSMIVGALLALCGTLVQGLFRNPLAEPGLMGVSSGATLMVVIVMVLLPGLTAQLPAWARPLLLPLVAFSGGLFATRLVMLLGHGSAYSPLRLILAGVAFNMVAAAGIGLCAYLATNEQLRTLTFWNLGSFSAAGWDAVLMTGVVLIGLAALSMRLYRPLNALLLGESEARHLGFDVPRLKRRIVYLSAAGVGAAVAFTGVIGFIGLVVPHIVRMLVGPDHRRVLPLSLGFGALLTLWADWIARTLISPAELPVGIVTSLLGGPFFIYLIHRQRGRLT